MSVSISFTTRPRIRRAVVFTAFTVAALSLLGLSCDQPPSAPLGPAAPDTTTHDFEWDVSTLGYDHTFLYDVYALSDTDVWAVGDITEWDAEQRKLLHHTAAHWDGRSWKIHDIMYHLQSNQPDAHKVGVATAVFGFSPDNIIVCLGCMVFRWNGREFIEDTRGKSCFTGGVTKIWGSNENDVWFVGAKGYQGTKGFVVHYDGKKYTYFDPGFPDDFEDVWGVGDTALCCASEWLFASTPTKVLRLTHGKVELAYQNGMQRSEKSIWYCKGMNPIITGNFNLQWNGVKWEVISGVPSDWFRMGVRGTAPNDYFMMDQAPEIFHFNGRSWKKWDIGTNTDYYYMAISCVQDNVWVVGDDGVQHHKGLIIHGRRKIPTTLSIGANNKN